jgi:hypothetical protein
MITSVGAKVFAGPDGQQTGFLPEDASNMMRTRFLSSRAYGRRLKGSPEILYLGDKYSLPRQNASVNLYG